MPRPAYSIDIYPVINSELLEEILDFLNTPEYNDFCLDWLES